MTHKLNHTGNCAVSTDRHWMAVTDKAPPVGVKCNLLTRYGMLDVCHLPETGTGYKLELRGGKPQYIKQHEAEK